MVVVCASVEASSARATAERSVRLSSGRRLAATTAATSLEQRRWAPRSASASVEATAPASGGRETSTGS